MNNINLKVNKTSKLSKFFGDKQFITILFSLFIPAALQQLITTAVTYVDTFFIAGFAPDKIFIDNQYLNVLNAGSIAKTSVGIATSIFNFPYMVLLGTITGIGIITSQFFGANDKQKLQQTVIYKLIMGFILIIPFVVIMMVIPNTIISVVRNVYNYEQYSEQHFINSASATYLFWSGPSLLIILFTHTIACSLKETNKPKVPLVASLCSMGANIIMDPLLIIFEDNLNDAVRNIAIATIVSRFIELCVMITYIVVKKFDYLLITRIKLDWQTFKITIKNSYLAILNDSLYGFATLFLIMCLLVYDEKSHDAFTSVSIIIQFANVIFPGMAASCSILVGSELGKNNIAQAKKNSIYLIVWGSIITLIFALILFILSWFINPILSPAPSGDTNSEIYKHWMDNQILAQKAEWVMMPVIFSQGLFSILYYSIKAGGSKYIFFTDGFVMSIWCIVLGSLTYTKVINTSNMSPLMIFFIVELNQIAKALFSFGFYRFTNWAINITEKI